MDGPELNDMPAADDTAEEESPPGEGMRQHGLAKLPRTKSLTVAGGTESRPNGQLERERTAETMVTALAAAVARLGKMQTTQDHRLSGHEVAMSWKRRNRHRAFNWIAEYLWSLSDRCRRGGSLHRAMGDVES